MQPRRRTWIGLAAALVAWAAVLAAASSRFGYDTNVIDMPVRPLVVVLLAAGLAYVGLLPGLVRRSAGLAPEVQHTILIVMIAAGLAARLVLFASTPILEDDYQRYLWDGAVTANGHNPYRTAPQSVLDALPAGPLAALAQQSGDVLARVGHGELTTIYPPIAQAAFALAHVVEPWSLASWRALLLVCDLATLALLLVLLTSTGRSPLWAALYWWNPIVVKELFNSAHMDGLLGPVVIGALLLAQRHPFVATSAIGIAFGIKFWPALLLPLVWRPLLADPRTLAKAALVFAPFAVAALAPQVLTGLDQGAGAVAYAASWSRNSALYPALEATNVWLLAAATTPTFANAHAALATRGLIAVALAAIVAALAIRPIASREDLTRRATIAIGALLVLMPAQYPWYSVWLAPLLVLHPIRGFLLLPATLPLYELYFHYAAREQAGTFTGVVVWLIWLPVWAVLLADWVRARQPSD